MEEEKRLECYTERLGAMLRMATVSSYEDTDMTPFYAFHDLLKELFPHITAVCEWEEFEGSLLLKWKGNGSGLPLLFMNHHDVVEPQDKGWTHPPFSGEVFDGKLWGRGALDTKGGLWGMLQAADELAEAGFVPKQDIYFESSCCEETTFGGAKHFAEVLEQRGIRFDFVLDEGGMIAYEPIAGAKGTFAMIGLGERGSSDLKFIARSAGGHGSAPEKNTPWVRLAGFITEADKPGLFKAELNPVLQEMLRRMAPSVSGPMKQIYARPEKFKLLLEKVMSSSGGAASALVRSTIAFTMAEGSEGRNVIPAAASVVGNMRCSHHQGFRGSLAAVTALAKKHDIEVEVLEEAMDTPLSDFRSPRFTMLEQAVEQCFPGVKSVPYFMTGCSDARFMARLTDNCFHFVPFIIDKQQLESIHGIDENVSIDTLIPAVKFYKLLMGGSPE